MLILNHWRLWDESILDSELMHSDELGEDEIVSGSIINCKRFLTFMKGHDLTEIMYFNELPKMWVISNHIRKIFAFI